MLVNKRRDNFIEFIYYNFQNIKNQILPFLGLFISLIGEKNKFTPYIKIGFYVLIAGIIIYSFLKWYNKTFEFNDNMIRISEGVFSKRNNDIPYNRVKSVNTSDSLLKRLFGIANFSVELIGGNKVQFVLKRNEIIELSERLFDNIGEETKTSKIKKLSVFEYFLMSFTNISVFLASFSLTTTIFTFAMNHFGEQLGLKEDESEKNGKEILDSLKQTELVSFDFLGPTLLAFLLLFAVSYILSYVYIYLTYGNFLITSNSDDIHIEYGIINKKNYHIPKKQIRTLRINEPFIYRFFGFAQLKVDNIGLNEQNSSSVLLHPIIKRTLIEELLNTHLPIYKVQDITHKPQKLSLLHYLIKSVFYPIIAIAILTIFFHKLIYLILIFPLFIIYGYVKWKHSGLAFNEQFITIQKTIGLKRTMIITLKKYTETTRTTQSIFMKKQNLLHYRIAVYSEKVIETYECLFLDSSSKEQFHNYLNR